MTPSRSKPKFRFQAKVLIPVVTVMVLFLLGTVALVNNRIKEQLQNETGALLATADNQFTNSLRTYSENLIAQFRQIPNLPSFYPIAAKFRNPTDDKRFAVNTMTGALGDVLDAQARGIAVLAFADSSGQLLAGTNRDSRIDANRFCAACAPFIKSVTDNREPEAHIVQADHSLFNAVIVPSFEGIGGEFLGTLIFGVALDSAAARQLKSPNSQIAFIAGDQITASTLEKPELNGRLMQDYNDLTGAGSNLTAASTLKLQEEHFGARPGKFSLPASQGNAGYLLLVSYEKPLQALSDERRSLVLCSLLGMILSSAIVWVVVRRVTQPLRQLRDSAEAVGRGDFSQRIEIHSNDELGELAGVFNHMTGNLQKSLAQLEKTVEILRTTQEKLIHTEKLSAVGEFVAGVAHELNNPLTSLIGYAELLQATTPDDKARTALKRISNSADRCHKIVQSLLSFARQHPPERKLTNVNSLVDSVVEILIYELRTNNIQVARELSPHLPRLLIDPHQIQQVFLNIVNNARQAIEGCRQHGVIHISTGAKDQRVWIRFKDDGPGISEENLGKIFNPFFTTKPVGKGTGLGLSLSYGILQEHGGSIAVESKPGHGTTFIIELPITADAELRPPEAAAPTAPKLPRGNGRSILVVDDEEDILELVRETLQHHGYRIETALDGQKALEHLSRDNFDLIVSDWKMPGMNGQQLYQRLLESNPVAATRTIFMTGDVLSEKIERYLHEQGKTCLTKPFSLVDFQQAIGEVLEKS